MSCKQKICFVVHGYGSEICGGAEKLCHMLAERLLNDYEIDIVTTTSSNTASWDAFYKPGISFDNEICVRRFNAEHITYGKNVTIQQLLQNKEYSYEDEIAFLQNVGPYSIPMFDYIRLNHHKYKAMIFFTYLFYHTAIASMGIPNAILLPTAHDEPYIYLPHFARLFRNAQAFLFNTEAEKDLIEKIIQAPITAPHEIVGCGIDMPEERKIDNINLEVHSPYILYLGRVCEGKGVGELIDDFIHYKNSESKNNLKLVLIGEVGMQIPNNKDIISLGFVSEEVKNAYLQNATALINPSRFESLSLCVLEAMACGCPVIVTGNCAVTKSHIEKSHAGRIYTDYQSFAEALDFFLQISAKDLQKIKNAGQKYVRQNYAWTSIIAKVKKVINHFPDVLLTEEKNISNEVKPAFAQNNVPVVFASDNNYVGYLSTAMQSVVDNSSSLNNYDFLILSDNISNINQKNIKEQFANYKNISVRFIECAYLLNRFIFNFYSQRLSRSTFARLLCLDILQHYEKIVYLDCDIIALADVADLFNLKIDNNYFGAISDGYIDNIRKYQKDIENYLIHTIKCSNSYFNAGVLVLNLKELRKHFTSDELIKIAISQVWQWEDQDVLNYVSQGHVKWLEEEWNVIWLNNNVVDNLMRLNKNYVKSLHNPKIIHYAGGTLPTKNMSSPYKSYFWKYARKTPYYEDLFVQRCYMDFAAQNSVNTVFQNVSGCIRPTAQFKYNHWQEHVFSVKNEYRGSKKFKVITLCGLKIRKKARN